jgi:hypothetical protein
MKQLQFLEQRRAEIIRWELSLIEELEKLEEEERIAREGSTVAASSTVEPGPEFDWAALASPSAWDPFLGAVGDTGSPPPQIPSGS